MRRNGAIVKTEPGKPSRKTSLTPHPTKNASNREERRLARRKGNRLLTVLKSADISDREGKKALANNLASEERAAIPAARLEFSFALSEKVAGIMDKLPQIYRRRATEAVVGLALPASAGLSEYHTFWAAHWLELVKREEDETKGIPPPYFYF